MSRSCSRPVFTIILLLYLQLFGGCLVSKQAYLTAHDGRRAAEASALKAEQRQRELRRRRESLETALSRDPVFRRGVRLKQQVAALNAEIERTRGALESCRLEHAAAQRPKPWVSVGETRLWDQRHRSFQSVVQGLIKRRLPQLEHCYRLHGWAGQADRPLSGALWVLVGIGDGWPREPRIAATTVSANGSHPDTAARAGKLQACVQDEFTKPHQPGQRGKKIWLRLQGKMLRVAQLLIFADSATAASKVKKPPFSWPWKKPDVGRAGDNEICSPGQQRRFELAPRFSRPCKAGLRCCYPCGIQGCDSVCMPSCPQNLP